VARIFPTDAAMTDAPYRVEAAKSGRSMCTVSKEHIEKGDLRLGSFVSMGGSGSYKWRKLSCITSRVAANITKELGGPMNIDGFNEISPEQQAEVLKAFEVASLGGAAGAGAPTVGTISAVPAAPKAKAKAKGKGKAKAKAKTADVTVTGGAAGSSSSSTLPGGLVVPPPLATPTVLTAAHEAIDLAKAANWIGVYKALSLQPGLVNVRPDVREFAVLHQAAFHGDVAAVAGLLDYYGADPGICTKFGQTAVDVAVQHGHEAVAEIIAKRLTVAGETDSLASTDEVSGSAMELTPEKPPKGPSKVPLAAGNEVKTAHAAIDLAKDGRWSDLFALLDKRRDILDLRPDVREYGILHQAAFHGCKDAVRTLIDKYGADVAQRTRHGLTAQDVADERGHAEVAEIIALHSKGTVADEAEDDFKMVQMPDGTWKVQMVGAKAGGTSCSSSALEAKPAETEVSDSPTKLPVAATNDDTPPTKKARIAATGTEPHGSSASAASATCPGALPDPRVDEHFPEAKSCHIYEGEGGPWNCRLTRKGFGSSGTICILQLLRRMSPTEDWFVWMRSGSATAKGSHEALHFSEAAGATATFRAKFLEKTGNNWERRASFKPFFGKFMYSEEPGAVDISASVSSTAAGASASASASGSGPTPQPEVLTEEILQAAHGIIDLAKAGKWKDLYSALERRRELVNVRPAVREFAALHQAAFYGSVDAVHTLVGKYGADPAMGTKLGVTSAEVARGAGHGSVADILQGMLK